jgi:hypothetical protein
MNLDLLSHSLKLELECSIAKVKNRTQKGVTGLEVSTLLDEMLETRLKRLAIFRMMAREELFELLPEILLIQAALARFQARQPSNE